MGLGMGKRLGALIGAVVTIILVGPGSADAATFDVDSTPDATHVGGCTAAPDDCSIRDAVAAANASTDASNTINVPAGTYPITAGQLVVDPAVSTTTAIAGAGARDTTLDAGGASRVFAIESSDTTLSGVTVTGGSSTDLAGPGPDAGDGGGIIVSYGGIGQLPSLTVVDSTVAGNTAGFQGGGIDATSFHNIMAFDATFPVTVLRSTITNNHLTGGSPPTAAIGAGVNTFGDLTITNSTITGNTVDSPTVVNLGGGVGAGISPVNTGPSTVTLTNSTIANNTVTGAPTSSGGGLAISSSSASVTTSVTNTIIFGNTVNGAEQDCFGVVAPTSANNLTGDASCLFTDAGSAQTADAGLGALDDNGGPTNTLALRYDSPAVDKGTDTGCPAIDQRGISRPQGTACDIGAFEVVPPPPPPPPAPVPSADLGVALTAQPASPHLGDKVKFTFSVTNAGPDAATDTVLTGKLPAPASRVVPPDGCTVAKIKSSRVPKRRVTCDLGTVQPGAVVTRKVKVRPDDRTKDPRGTGQVTSGVADPAPTNNVAKLKVDVAG
jgi:uncharacterized repeat protein (TIGR01451 family)